MRTQFIIITLFFLSISSCLSQSREIVSKSTVKLEGRNTNIRDFIEIDGYYRNIDTVFYGHSGMMFFEDGMHGSLWFKKGVSEDMKRTNLSQAIYSWKEKGQTRWGDYWGVYRIEQDTIIVQNIVKSGFFSSGWSFSELKYEIIDRQTLKLIYQKSLIGETEYDKYPYEISKRNIIDKFIPADSLPSSDCWLKEKKWIWRNESDWKEYMERIKQIKKQYKKK